MRLLMLFCSLIIFVGCTSSSKQPPKKVLDSSIVYITTQGEFMGLVTDEGVDSSKYWVYQNDFQAIKQVSAMVGEDMQVRCKEGRVRSLFIEKIKSKEKWPEVVKYIDQLNHLEYLNIQSSGVTSLNLKNVPRLKKIFIHNTAPSFDTLIVSPKAKKLEMIFVSNTNIHYVIFPVKYPLLKKVTFDNHHMTDIDSSFANLIGVEYLSVSYGKVTKINPVLEKLPRLKELHVEHNSLTDYNLQIPGLKVLYLPGNPFKDTNAIKRRYPQLELKFDDGI